MTYILYNPNASVGKCKEESQLLKNLYPGAELCDMTKIESYTDFFAGLEDSDDVIICGGDGTLNRFVNDADCDNVKNNIYYYPVGSGNDFAHDLGKQRASEPDYIINPYLTGLPTVDIEGRETKFINGIGFGIDGYCCEEGDRLREYNRKNNKERPINYTSIAIKGLLGKYKPTGAVVTVDGKQYRYKKVWIAPTMNGRFYGGGMMPTPAQDRLNENGEVSCMVFHDSGKLKTLMIFPSIFKGKHIKNTKYVDVFKGKNITVEFDEPRALQIDGETRLNVKKYTVRAYAEKPAAKIG